MHKTIVIFAIFMLSASLAVAEAYRVGVNDQLNVRVAIWDASTGAITEPPGVSGVYVVGADGNIAVTLAGSVDVAGVTLPEIASKLETALASYAPVGQSPRVSVAIEAYAPVYLAGQVDTPGVYDFAAGLTVFKAVALAGGLAELKPLPGEERNFVNARGTIKMLEDELVFLTARRDRITAELDGAADLAAIEANAELQDAWATEEAILQSRNMLYAHQLTSLEAARTSLRDALQVLEDKRTTSQAQLDVAEAELARSEDLVERGLSAQTGAFDRARYVSEVQTRVLDIERSILEAQQALQNNERDAGVLKAARQEENITALQQTNVAIAEVEAQIATQLGLLDAASAGLDAAQTTLLDPQTAQVVFEVTRTHGGEIETFAVDRNFTLQPGDVIEVLFAPPTMPSN